MTYNKTVFRLKYCLEPLKGGCKVELPGNLRIWILYFLVLRGISSLKLWSKVSFELPWWMKGYFSSYAKDWRPFIKNGQAWVIFVQSPRFHWNSQFGNKKMLQIFRGLLHRHNYWVWDLFSLFLPNILTIVWYQAYVFRVL